MTCRRWQGAKCVTDFGMLLFRGDKGGTNRLDAPLVGVRFRVLDHSTKKSTDFSPRRKSFAFGIPRSWKAWRARPHLRSPPRSPASPVSWREWLGISLAAAAAPRLLRGAPEGITHARPTLLYYTISLAVPAGGDYCPNLFTNDSLSGPSPLFKASSSVDGFVHSLRFPKCCLCAWC